MHTVLYVDDEPDDLELGRIFLERGELRVKTRLSACEGRTAVTETGDVPISIAEYGRVVGGEVPFVRFGKRYRARDDDPVRVRVTVSPIRDEQGAVEHLLSVIEELPGDGDEGLSPRPPLKT